ncbi:MAG: oligosaccharide flippase family protein [Bacteroidales bacterium]|nr:oligosaccharide flippase family protein [Bacteroidales bacterium]
MEYSRKSFLGNLLLLVGLNLLIKPFWIFGIEVSLQNLVGTEAYGLYFTLFNLTFIFNMLLDMGTTSFNNRSIARDREALQHYFPRILTLRLLLGGLYALVMLGAGLLTRCTASDFRLLVPLAVNQFLSLLILYLRSNVSGMLMFKTDSLLSVVDRLIMIICCSVLIWGHVTDRPFQISWFVYIQMFSYGVTALFALLVVCRHCRFRRLEWDFPFIRKVLVRSFPFALLALLTNIHNRTDAVLLKWMLPDGVGVVQAGIYASAYRLLDAAVIIAYLLSVILLPLFSHLIGHRENFRPILKTSFVLMYVYGLLLALFSCLYKSEVMGLLYDHNVDASTTVFGLLILSIFPIGLTYVFGSLLTANGSLRALNRIALSAVCVNLVANLLLIPRWQAMGSAVASLLTQGFIIISEMVVARRTFRLNVPWRFMAGVAGYTAAALLCALGCRHLPLHWGGQLSVAVAACIGMLFLFRLVRKEEVSALFGR